jgi:CheY-like chemotaxis protein
MSSHTPRIARVLVVEDDEHMRCLIATTLRQRGCHVVEAAQGVDLLGWMGSALWNPPENELDVIVSDVNLPDLTALEVMASLRACSGAVPVILVTASDEVGLSERAYQLGATAVFRKPVDLSALGALVTSLRARHRVGRTFRIPQEPHGAV